MLSRLEKQEILEDARKEIRKEAFRQMRVTAPLRSFDAYLQFLQDIQKTFSSSTLPTKCAPRQDFKL
jgi:hypothetical protein